MLPDKYKVNNPELQTEHEKNYRVHIDAPDTQDYTLGRFPSLCDSNDSCGQGRAWNS